MHIPSDFIAACLPEKLGGLTGDKAVSVVFDNSKIKRFVPGYCATMRFGEGIRRTIAWFDADPARKLIDDEANAQWDKLIECVREGTGGSGARRMLQVTVEFRLAEICASSGPIDWPGRVGGELLETRDLLNSSGQSLAGPSRHHGQTSASSLLDLPTGALASSSWQGSGSDRPRRLERSRNCFSSRLPAASSSARASLTGSAAALRRALRRDSTAAAMRSLFSGVSGMISPFDAIPSGADGRRDQAGSPSKRSA